MRRKRTTTFNNRHGHIREWPTLLLVMAGLFCLLLATPVAATSEGPVSPEIPLDSKPILGLCLIQTDALRAENNPKPMDMIRGAVEAKLTGQLFVRESTVTDADFISFIGKKDILPDSTGLLRELKLPVLLEYGRNKKVDHLLVVIGDAAVVSHNKTNISHSRDKDGKIIYSNTYDTVEVDYADVTLRVALVDVKKAEYRYNLLITRRSDGPDFFANPVRSVINSGSRKVVDEFNRQVVF